MVDLTFRSQIFFFIELIRELRFLIFSKFLMEILQIDHFLACSNCRVNPFTQPAGIEEFAKKR